MKYKDLIIKWANGAKVEAWIVGQWRLIKDPYWDDSLIYREHIPARTAFEAGKKVLGKYKNAWIRLIEADNFTTLDWEEYVVVDPDTEWRDKFNKGVKLEFQFYNSSVWIKLTNDFIWDNNSAYKFREASQPLVFTEGPIVISSEGSLVRTDIPLTFYGLNSNTARIEINITTGIIKFI